MGPALVPSCGPKPEPTSLPPDTLRTRGNTWEGGEPGCPQVPGSRGLCGSWHLAFKEQDRSGPSALVEWAVLREGFLGLSGEGEGGAG